MTIEVGIYTGQNNKVQKTFTAQHTFDSVTLKQGTSVQSPVLIIRGTTDTGKKDLLTATYAHIEAFERYYYVTEAISVRNDLIELHLKSDPLMSFASGIYKNHGYIYRSASTEVANYYMDDGNFKISADDNIVIDVFPKNGDISFTDDSNNINQSYIMLIAGTPDRVTT